MRDFAVTSDPSSGSLKATKNLSTKSVAKTALQTSSVMLLPFLNGLREVTRKGQGRALTGSRLAERRARQGH